jgi:glycosyltransferase 2 family protein
MATSKLKKYAWVVLKLTLSIVGFWYAFHRIDISNFRNTFRDSNGLLIALALVFYLGSQAISSVRLKYILTVVNDHVPAVWNLKLYFEGMAYNLFLPGGIGGDAYKIFAYSKRSGIPAKKYLFALLADRLFGLAAIIILMGIAILFMPNHDFWWISQSIGLVGLGVSILGYLLAHLWFALFKPVYLKALLYSVAIQIIQMVTVVCIIFSTEHDFSQFMIPALFVFLLSSVATAIPVFLGGLGAREVVFATMFPLFGLPGDQGVWIALVFSLIVVMSSLPGLLLGFGKQPSEQRFELDQGQEKKL